MVRSGQRKYQAVVLALAAIFWVSASRANPQAPEKPQPKVGQKKSKPKKSTPAPQPDTQTPSPPNTSFNADLVGIYNNAEGAPVIPLIERTQSQLDIEIYEITDTQVRASIRSALKRGVHVRVVKEPEPVNVKCFLFKPVSASDNSDCLDQKRLIAEVNQSGQFVEFNKSELCGIPGKSCFEHGKIILSDQKLALISSGNFNSSNLCDKAQNPGTCNRDYTIITDDTEVVSVLTQVFEKDLSGQRFDVSSYLTPSVAQKLTISPLSLQPIVDFIGSAQESILIENQYLHEPSLNEALIKAAQRGVKVSITVASFCSFGRPKASEVSRMHIIYGAFDGAGIDTRIFTRQILIDGVPGYLHAKAIVVDGRRAWVGSVNGSTTSVSQNREYGLFFERSDWVSKLQSVMIRDHSDPNTESWQESLSCTKDPLNNAPPTDG